MKYYNEPKTVVKIQFDKPCKHSKYVSCDDPVNCETCFVYMFMQPKDGKVGKVRNYNDED